MIWERAPKYRYCRLVKLEFDVYDAVANFYDGRQATLDILKSSTLTKGTTRTAYSSLNNKRRRSAT